MIHSNLNTIRAIHTFDCYTHFFVNYTLGRLLYTSLKDNQ